MTSIKFDRLVVLFNPKSSRAGLVQQRITDLQKAYPKKVVAKPINPAAEQGRLYLQKHLKPGDILIPAGGDGTISAVVEDLLHKDTPQELRGIPVLPMGTGRMNDVARMLNSRYYSSPVHVLKHGFKLPIYPLKCTFTPLKGDKEKYERLAIYCFGLGCGAEICKMLNDEKFRASQQKQPQPMREVTLFSASGKVVKDAKEFYITLDGEHQSIYDLSISSGHIAAGYYRLPAKLSKPHFYWGIIADKSLFSTLNAMVRLFTNTYNKGRLDSYLSFTLHDPVWAQISAEPFMPPTPSKVDISINKEPVIMLATSSKA